MIRQEDPGRKEKVMFLSPRAPHAGQALEFGFLEPPPMGKQPATDEKESVGHYQAAQAGHGGELYAQSHVHEPQSLWSTRLCATPLETANKALKKGTMDMRWFRFLCSVGMILVLIRFAGAAQNIESCTVSISNLKISNGEVIGAFELDVTAGAIQAVQNLPVGWYVVIDNDASWRAKLAANTTVGAASLTSQELKNIRLVIKKGEPDLAFNLSGVVSITKDYKSERKVELKMSDFVVTPRR
jgi:hypothetical protein